MISRVQLVPLGCPLYPQSWTKWTSRCIDTFSLYVLLPWLHLQPNQVKAKADYEKAASNTASARISCSLRPAVHQSSVCNLWNCWTTGMESYVLFRPRWSFSFAQAAWNFGKLKWGWKFRFNFSSWSETRKLFSNPRLVDFEPLVEYNQLIQQQNEIKEMKKQILTMQQHAMQCYFKRFLVSPWFSLVTM